MHDCLHAEKSWKQRNAEAMDMEVSSDEDNGELPAAKKSRRQQANDGSSAVQMQKVEPPNSILLIQGC